MRARPDMSPSSARSGGLNTTDNLLLPAVFACAAVSVVFWAGAAITAALSGHPVPEVNLGAGVMALAEHRGDPSAAWGRPVGPAWLYWTSTSSVIAVFVAEGATCQWAIAKNREARGQDPRRIDGLASKAEVANVAGAKTLIARAADRVCPNPRSPNSDIGWAVHVGWTVTPASRTPWSCWARLARARAYTSSSTPSWTPPAVSYTHLTLPTNRE